MKVIIAGSRHITDAKFVVLAVQSAGFDITEIVSGGAPGVDRCGESIATMANIPVKVFPADWEKHGRSAGPKRNRQMAQYADALIAIWDGTSKGTWNMIWEMEQLNKPVFVLRYPQPTTSNPRQG